VSTNLPRYCPERDLPPYTYVPGVNPHPMSDERGHSYGHQEPRPEPLDEATYGTNATYLFAIDLFNHGYYWEAHEAWESLWHVAGRTGPTADFLKGLIKLAAAGVKLKEGRVEGVRRHAARAVELLSNARCGFRREMIFGLDVDALIYRVLHDSIDEQFAITFDPLGPRHP
jgi:uncharacterized protein